MQEPPDLKDLPLSRSTHKELKAQSARQGLTPKQLAIRYIQEGLLMEEHPLIVFRNGPTGRRAHVVGAGDVWEIILTLRDNRGCVDETAKYLEVRTQLIDAAAIYYAAFPKDVDDQIEENLRAEQEAGRAAQEGLRKLFGRSRPW